MTFYERVAARPGGGRALARARLQRSVLRLLDQALRLSPVRSQSELAEKLRIRRSAVSQVFRGDGNVRISTLAEYLYELGFEANIELVSAGELRSAVTEDRPVRTINERRALDASVSVLATTHGPRDSTDVHTCVIMPISFACDLHPEIEAPTGSTDLVLGESWKQPAIPYLRTGANDATATLAQPDVRCGL